MTETNADPTTVNFKLNPKAVWGDGSPVDADDWTAMWKACSGENTKFQCASTQGYDQIADITTGADKFDVTVTFKGNYPDWTQPWFPLVRAESVADPTVFNSGWKALNNDWLSGPFKVENYNRPRRCSPWSRTTSGGATSRCWTRSSTGPSLRTRQAAAVRQQRDRRVRHRREPDSFTRAKAVAGGAVRQAAGPNFRHFTFNSKAGLLNDQKASGRRS